MRTCVAAVAIGAAATLAACGEGMKTATQHASAPATFAWVSQRAPHWQRASLPSYDASVPYPPGFRLIRTDPGTVSVARYDARRRIVGYLNLTPRQGAEQLKGWARFRIRHNADEGDSALHMRSAAEHLNFATGSGSCIVDDYRTSRSRYREIACLVHGKRADTVAVGAALPDQWSRQGPQLERAIAGLST